MKVTPKLIDFYSAKLHIFLNVNTKSRLFAFIQFRSEIRRIVAEEEQENPTHFQSDKKEFEKAIDQFTMENTIISDVKEVEDADDEASTTASHWNKREQNSKYAALNFASS